MTDEVKAGAVAGAADAGKAVEKAAAAGTIINAADKGAAGAVGGAEKAADGAVVGADKVEGGADKGAAQADWRTRMAGNDPEALKRLSRFPDEGALFKSYRALETRLSSGEFKKALPEGASPEEVATWRKENGLPEKPEGYVEKIALPNGLVLGEADKPIVADFAAAALEANVAPEAFNKLVSQYYVIQDKQRAAQEEADVAFKQQSEDTLRSTWPGAEFRQNLVAIQNLMAGWPEGLATQVLAGRDSNGRKLGDNPAFVQQMAALARELNPAATLVPVGTSDPTKGVTDELAAIRKMRSEDPNKYEADKKLQARELELIEADLKMKKRA